MKIWNFYKKATLKNLKNFDRSAFNPIRASYQINIEGKRDPVYHNKRFQTLGEVQTFLKKAEENILTYMSYERVYRVYVHVEYKYYVEYGSEGDKRSYDGVNPLIDFQLDIKNKEF
jgi:hypothetical protein